MRRIVTAVFLALVLIFSAMPFAVSGASYLPDLKDKSIYITPDYISGDCILSSAKNMLRRAAIARGSYGWDSITNTSLRGSATIGGTSFRNSFSYTNDGITYKIVNKTLPGDESGKMNAITTLLASHPEGIIVWGADAATTGPHGVLITGYADGVLYAADSSYNSMGLNYGILPWDETTMKPIGNCSDAWYISSINGVESDAAAPSTGTENASSPTNTQPEQTPQVAAASVNILPVKGVKMSSVRAPGTLAKGGKFTIMGKIKASKKIKKVRVIVINSEGKTVQSASARPNKKSYNIKKLDSKIKFGKLKSGSYKFKVRVRTGSKWQTLVNQSFTVD